MNIKAVFCAALLQSGLLAMSGCSSKVDSNQFLARSLQDGLAEIQLSQLALEKTNDQEVRQFAQRMIKDHTEINREIAQLARQSNAKLPQDMSAKQKIAYGQMAISPENRFEDLYMRYNVSDHEHDLKDFSEQAKRGSLVEVRAFAARTLPVLESHLQLAKAVAAESQP